MPVQSLCCSELVDRKYRIDHSQRVDESSFELIMKHLFWFQLLLIVCCLSTLTQAQCYNGYTYGQLSLFDGETLDGWTNRKGEPVGSGWSVEDGMIHFNATAGGDIVSKDEFVEFDLEFEWKIAKGGNSGVKYWVQFGTKKMSAIEYQLLDEVGHKQGGSRLHATGDMYDLFAADANLRNVKPVGEFNHSRIVARYGRIQHWLNGVKILDVCLNHHQWPQAVEKSKFNKIPGYACNRGGKILLQAHGSKVWFRNLRVRPL